MKKLLFSLATLAALAFASDAFAACAVTNLQVKDNAAVTAAVPYADDGSGANNCSPQIQIKQGGNVAGVGSNAGSAVATSSTNLFAVAYMYGFNGTSWDQLQVDGSKNLKVVFGSAQTVGLAAGSQIVGKISQVDSGGTDATDTVNHAVKVNVVAGSSSLSAPIPDRQSSVGTLTTTAANHGACGASSCVTLSSQGAASVLIDISANTNVTIVVECAGPNNNYVSCSAYPVNTVGPTGVTTIAAAGQWIVPSGGYANVSVRVSVVGSTPSATVALEANAGDNLSIIAAWLAQLHTDTIGALPAGTNNIGFVSLQANTTGGCSPGHTLSAASNNSTSIKGSAGTLCSITVVQTTTTLGDLRLYDSASAPTCSSGTGVVANYAIQSNATSPGISPNLGPYGMTFANGIGFCLTGAVADNDNTNFVTGVQINYTWK